MAGYIGSKSSVTQVDGYTEAEADAEFVNDPNGAITVSGSNVGIGTSSPVTFGANTSGLTLNGTGNYQHLTMQVGGVSQFSMYSNGTSGTVLEQATADPMSFLTSGSERLRIDASGNLNIGRTSTGAASDGTGGSGINITQTGAIEMARNGSPALFVNRTTSDGDIIQFRKNGTTIGTIGVVNTDHLVIAATYGTGTGIKFSNNLVKPVFDSGADKDNGADFGSSSARWDDIYATNGTIQTSDFNEKQDIASLTATEMLVGKRISALFKTFRWKDSVAEKGDNARTHTGVIAQDVQAAFTAEGLDAGDYALFISTTWWETQTEVPAVEAVDEVLDEDGNVTTEAVEAVDAYTRTDTYDTEAEAPEGATSKTRMGIRYPELLSFIAAYNEQRFASIEARLTALEA